MAKEEEKQKEIVVDIADLQQDTQNFNKGTDEGRRLMEKSFTEFGAGRSVLVDKNNNIIAGNKSTEAAIAAGIKKVRIIETTGDELIAVKRTDVDLDSEKGRKLALADNATAQANLSWDETQLQAVADEFDGFDIGEWGMDVNFDLPDCASNTEEDDDEIDEHEVIRQASNPSSIKWYSDDTNYNLGNLYRSKINPSIVKKIQDGIERGEVRKEIADILQTRATQCAIFNFDEIIKYYRSKDATPTEKELLRRLYLVFVTPLELVESGILKIKQVSKAICDEELMTLNKNENDEEAD